MIKEEVLKKIKEKNDTYNVVPGEYLGFFKKIGDNKSVSKVMNVKPDFFIMHENSSYDCLFFEKSAFMAFFHLSKLLILKELGCEFDFSSLIIYADSQKLVKAEEKGITNEKKETFEADAYDKINQALDYYRQKLGKKIELNI